MCAIFSICGSESQPGLQLVEKLAVPLVILNLVKIIKFKLQSLEVFRKISPNLHSFDKLIKAKGKGTQS